MYLQIRVKSLSLKKLEINYVVILRDSEGVYLNAWENKIYEKENNED